MTSLGFNFFPGTNFHWPFGQSRLWLPPDKFTEYLLSQEIDLESNIPFKLLVTVNER
jgi:hypothetical protein